MLKVAICDDEKIFCEMISRYCKDILIKQKIKYEEFLYYSGEDLLADINAPDILFLDIDMPQLDGITVAENICRLYPDCFIIFVTSHHDKARLGYKVNARRFLFKPIDLVEFEEAICAAIRVINEHRIIVIEERGTDKFVRISDVVYLESLGFGCAIYTKNNHYISKRTLDYHMKQFLNEGFYQIHKSFVISLDHIVEITKNSSVIMDCGVELPLARRKKAVLHKRMIEHVKNNAI